MSPPPDAVQSPDRPPGAAVLRWIAAFKLLKAAGLVALGIALVRFIARDGPHDRAAAHAWVDEIPAGSHVRLVHQLLAKVQAIPPGQLKLLAVGLFVYAGLYAVEGIGLLRRKHWAEWMVVVTTAGLLPVEAYELVHKPTAVRAAVLVLNVATVTYLLWRLRRERRARRDHLTAAAPPGR